MTHLQLDPVDSGIDENGNGRKPNTAIRHSAGLPEQVIVHAPGLFPEAVAWDADRERFLVTSVTRGTVTAVRDDGTPGEG